MRINTNIDSLNAIESNTNSNIQIRSSLEKLSSGLQINKASDDASGLAIADKLRTQKNSIVQSVANASSAVTMIQIADKAMAEQSNILDIVKVKLVQGATATTSDEGRKAIAKDIHKLLTQLDNIASQTNYNGISLLQKASDNRGNADVMTFQVGDNSANIINTSSSIEANTQGLGLGIGPFTTLEDLVSLTENDGSGMTSGDAVTYLKVLDKAIDDLNTMRSDYGSLQNQIESATRNMMTQITNIAAAESVIRDVDYASESANFNRFSIVGQSSTYALAQANMRPSDMLKLLV